MSMHYDRQGNPMDGEAWGKAFGSNKHVNYTKLSDGKIVSTVWLGLDHRFGNDGPPLIFETMVFASEEDYSDLECARYSTEEAAQIGHDAMVAKWELK